MERNKNLGKKAKVNDEGFEGTIAAYAQYLELSDLYCIHNEDQTTTMWRTEGEITILED